jgi:hypothetical protein
MIEMWYSISRFFIALWFVGMVGVAVWNGGGVEAEGRGNESLYFPLIEYGDGTLPNYIGLARWCRTQDRTCYHQRLANFYIVRGDGSQWSTLAEGVEVRSAAWSPNGLNFVYAQSNPNITYTRTWLLPLATRQPRLLVENNSFAYVPKWSPDSQRLILIGSTEFHIYDVTQDTLSTYELPMIDPPSADTIVWSADSQGVAWTESEGYARRNVWLWGGEGSGAWRVFEGSVLYNRDIPLYWSPDGSRLLLNGVSGGIAGIYESNAAGDPAWLFLQNYTMQGWVDDGAKLVLLRDRKVYLAGAAGTDITLFFDNYPVSSYPDEISISPVGDTVAISAGDGFYLQGTDTSPYTQFPRCWDTVWQMDGTRVACFNLSGLSGTLTIIDLATRAIKGSIPSYYDNGQFLPQSEQWIGFDHSYIKNSPYPHPKFEGAYLFNIGTGRTKAFSAPDGEKYPIIEWRYMP